MIRRFLVNRLGEINARMPDIVSHRVSGVDSGSFLSEQHVLYVYWSKLDAIQLMRWPRGLWEGMHEGVVYHHVRTDPYDRVLTMEGALAGFRISLGNDDSLRGMVPCGSEIVRLEGGRDFVEFDLGTSRGERLDEVQDFCEIFASENGELAIAFLGVLEV